MVQLLHVELLLLFQQQLWQLHQHQLQLQLDQQLRVMRGALRQHQRKGVRNVSHCAPW